MDLDEDGKVCFSEFIEWIFDTGAFGCNRAAAPLVPAIHLAGPQGCHFASKDQIERG